MRINRCIFIIVKIFNYVCVCFVRSDKSYECSFCIICRNKFLSPLSHSRFIYIFTKNISFPIQFFLIFYNLLCKILDSDITVYFLLGYICKN